MSETPPDETLGAFLGDVAEKIAKAERAAIVAWLRGSDIQRADDIADAVEAGAHHVKSNAEPAPWPTCKACGGAKFYRWTTLDDASLPIQITTICVSCNDRVVTP